MKEKLNQPNKKNKNDLSPEREKKGIINFFEKEFGIPGEALKNIDVSKINIGKFSSYEAPFPHPELLREYENLKPGAIDILFNYVDKNLNHRIEMDNHKVVVEKNSIEMGRKYFELYKKLTLRGQLFSFFVALIDIGAALTCAFLNQPVVGAAIIAPLIGILSYLAFFKPDKRVKSKVEGSKKAR
ncbi:MAG: hypothetical protein GTO45_26795 [Candidatus Aminicenantes bacterium]|nr:hypothetical protein [Candidatus Aminicenantes bacterium]NIM82354.1 hypothetical protein [Candidatus Aminicenantes bacterium]NIN21737.1 hypothetical protein [Candidatus Aminicenantes bacterium]NIN45546.1 hypothetical protein [Candidatus Aminicenantes bacterium]NIN88377.1 hypothetical protein [Candidatus Aminicenantes bacterium]